MKQHIALFGIIAAALIFSACDGDSGNNGTEVNEGSSSSVVKSSSSSVKGSSSSLAVSSSGAKAAWDYLNPNITYGEMTDPRDKQVYKTVTIGTQTWMAQNLNYSDVIVMPNLAGNSWCYGNSVDSCAKYGRLYTWTAAMNVDSSYQSAANAAISSPQQGACPSDWHVPTDAEWTTLETAVGGLSTAGTALKSTGGWFDDNGDGTDAYGFSALPAGGRDVVGSFYDAGFSAGFWSATEDAAYSAYDRILVCGLANMDADDGIKKFAFSVRCVKD
ncbi:MAG: fibrobacter succinogenes major paralogous domain-containing protein [Fibrobacteraceae bacterium]|nr:fibrobacter succinogenes major paralogous domain-containing protein [Fibrobacteraceae bacterium]